MSNFHVSFFNFQRIFMFHFSYSHTMRSVKILNQLKIENCEMKIANSKGGSLWLA